MRPIQYLSNPNSGTMFYPTHWRFFRNKELKLFQTCFVIRKLGCSVVTTLDVTTTQDRTPQFASATKDFSGTDTAVFTVRNSQVSEGSVCLQQDVCLCTE